MSNRFLIHLKYLTHDIQELYNIGQAVFDSLRRISSQENSLSNLIELVIWSQFKNDSLKWTSSKKQFYPYLQKQMC